MLTVEPLASQPGSVGTDSMHVKETCTYYFLKPGNFILYNKMSMSTLLTQFPYILTHSPRPHSYYALTL